MLLAKISPISWISVSSSTEAFIRLSILLNISIDLCPVLIIDFFNINPNYYVCNGLLIENDKFSKVLFLIDSINEENVEQVYDIVNIMFDNIDTGFLYNETISKVKK